MFSFSTLGKNLMVVWEKYLEISAGILILKQCWRFCLEASVGVVPKNTKKAKKTRNTKKAAGKVLREESLGRRVASGSAESEAGLNPRRAPKSLPILSLSKFVPQ